MNWMKYRKIYFGVSGVFIIASIFGLVSWGLKLGVDFRGGAIIEYRLDSSISTEKVSNLIEDKTIEISSISKTGDDSYIFRLPPITQEEKEIIRTSLVTEYGEEKVEELRYEVVGPSVGPELVQKTVYAILVAAGIILIWIALQFKSIKFGASAVLAMLHDSFILIGSFSILGFFLGAEVDFLFVTALLTTLSFSVHDTIVVYDRIRESQGKADGGIYELANKAVSETMVRSLNNSFTIAFMLLSLLLLGGTTVKWFATALFIGTVLGTYSSPFVAVSLLVTWDEAEKKFKKS
jgi:preprotein translocase subunit SecF